MRTRLSSTWRHSSLSFSFSPFLSLSLPSSITLCLSFSFSRPTGVRRHNNCDTYRMHSFRVGNVSLDVATFASANAGGETLLPPSILPHSRFIHSHSLFILTFIYSFVRVETATYCATRIHTNAYWSRGTDGPFGDPPYGVTKIDSNRKGTSPKRVGSGANLMRDHLALTVCFSTRSGPEGNTLARSTERPIPFTALYREPYSHNFRDLGVKLHAAESARETSIVR